MIRLTGPAGLGDIADRILVAHAFLTRIPLPRPAGEFSADRLARAAVMFPLVGLVVGGAAGLARLGADPLGPLAATVLALAVGPIITGAFHEDGLADTADGLGLGERGRRLAAMRDSRLGTFGVLALVFAVLVRVGLLMPLGAGDAALALVAGHVLGRWSTLPLSRLAPPAGPDGLGAGLVRIGPAGLVAGTLLALALAGPALAAITPLGVALALAGAVAVTLGCALAWRRVFGGVTGDTFGATNQLVEMATYLAVAAVLA